MPERLTTFSMDRRCPPGASVHEVGRWEGPSATSYQQQLSEEASFAATIIPVWLGVMILVHCVECCKSEMS